MNNKSKKKSKLFKKNKRNSRKNRKRQYSNQYTFRNKDRDYNIKNRSVKKIGVGGGAPPPPPPPAPEPEPEPNPAPSPSPSPAPPPPPPPPTPTPPAPDSQQCIPTELHILKVKEDGNSILSSLLYGLIRLKKTNFNAMSLKVTGNIDEFVNNNVKNFKDNILDWISINHETKISTHSKRTFKLIINEAFNTQYPNSQYNFDDKPINNINNVIKMHLINLLHTGNIAGSLILIDAVQSIMNLNVVAILKLPDTKLTEQNFSIHGNSCNDGIWLYRNDNNNHFDIIFPINVVLDTTLDYNKKATKFNLDLNKVFKYNSYNEVLEALNPQVNPQVNTSTREDADNRRYSWMAASHPPFLTVLSRDNLGNSFQNVIGNGSSLFESPNVVRVGEQPQQSQQQDQQQPQQQDQQDQQQQSLFKRSTNAETNANTVKTATSDAVKAVSDAGKALSEAEAIEEAVKVAEKQAQAQAQAAAKQAATKAEAVEKTAVQAAVSEAANAVSDAANAVSESDAIDKAVNADLKSKANQAKIEASKQ